MLAHLAECGPELTVAACVASLDSRRWRLAHHDALPITGLLGSVRGIGVEPMRFPVRGKCLTLDHSPRFRLTA